MGNKFLSHIKEVDAICEVVRCFDDSSIIRNSLKRIFDSDYEIVMAKNGQEAMDIIKSNFDGRL